MSSIGPQLPPHLTKRKRNPEDENPDSPSAKTSKPKNDDEIELDGEDSDSDDGYGPRAPSAAHATKASPQRPPIGPTAPPSGSNTDEIALGSASDDEDTGPAPPPPAGTPKPSTQKPRRVMGPAPPPTDLTTRPTTGPDSESGPDSDDDYGPALPGATPSNRNTIPGATAVPPPEKEKPARDDWMLAPPEPTGYQERDPTKIRARKFASGAGATSRPSEGGGISKIWTETPEEKARRLADAVLGRGGGGEDGRPTASGSGKSKDKGRGMAVAAAAAAVEQERIRAFTEQTRGRSLYEEHQSAKKKDRAGGGKKLGAGAGDDGDDDDDPSKRAFDREKDMGLGMKITASQRKELLNRASDFGGRFQKGNYL